MISSKNGEEQSLLPIRRELNDTYSWNADLSFLHCIVQMNCHLKISTEIVTRKKIPISKDLLMTFVVSWILLFYYFVGISLKSALEIIWLHHRVMLLMQDRANHILIKSLKNLTYPCTIKNILYHIWSPCFIGQKCCFIKYSLLI